MRAKKYIFILFALFGFGVSGYAQSFYKTYPIPTGTSRISSEGYLLIPADSNRIALVGEWEASFDAWDQSLSLLTDSLGDTICSHGDFLPPGVSGGRYGLDGLYDLLAIPGGFAFIENGCAVYMAGSGGATAGVIFTDNRLHLKKIDTIASYHSLSLYNPNLYSFNNSFYFTGTPWAYIDTFYLGGLELPLYAPIWKLDTNGNPLWQTSLGPAVNECQIFYSIPTTDSQIAVLGITPPESLGGGPDTMRLMFYDANGNLKTNYRCSSIVNTFSLSNTYSVVGELIKLKNDILIIGNDTDATTQKLQLCIEVVDSLGNNLLNTKKFIVNNDTANIMPLSVYPTSDSTALLNYALAGSGLTYFLSVNYLGDSLGSFMLPACTVNTFDNGNILCETDTNNTFLVKEYTPNTSLVYKFVYPGAGQCNNIEPLPEGKGQFIMTGEVNDTLFIIREDTINMRTIVIPINNVTCNGAGNGEAFVSASGGIAPYTYSWNPYGGINATATGLSAGTYTVMVTDSNNLKGSATVTITQPTAIGILASVNTNISCNGGNNGSASSIVSGGTVPYTYLWSDASSQTTVSATGLLAGIYTLTVTDNNGCTTSTMVSISQPAAIIPSIMEYMSIKCNGDSNAVIFADATGGSGFYAYSWSDASSQATALATGLSVGNYTITVTDNNGCSGTSSTTITQPSVLNVVADSINEIGGSCNGSAWVMVTGGTPLYTYLWTGGLTTDTIRNQCTGNYCSTVTDANGCMDSVCVTINVSTGINNVRNSSSINIYPDPTSSNFTVELSNINGTCNLELFSILGKKIRSTELKTNTTNIDMSSEAEGVYLYRLIDKGGITIETGKIVVLR